MPELVRAEDAEDAEGEPDVVERGDALQCCFLYWDSEDARNAADLGPVAVAELYPYYPGRALLDAELGFRLRSGAWLSLGAANLLNTYPKVNPHGQFTVGNRYGQYSPFGYGGAYYYARVSVDGGRRWSGLPTHLRCRATS